MRRPIYGVLLAAALIVLVAYMALPLGCSRMPDVRSARPLKREARIDPDYTSLVIPPNIAPLNFRIMEHGRDFVVRVSSKEGGKLDIHCPDRTCRIPVKFWRRLLETSKGGTLFLDIFAQDADGTWLQFKQVTNSVAKEPIDSHIVYRLLSPNKATSRIKGIYQRDIESFRESAIITLRDGTFTCFNCHTFHQHDPNTFLFHVRVKHAGMMLVMDGETRKINTEQAPMFRPLAYASWHPGGRHIAATCNRFLGHFPANDSLYYFLAIEKRGDLLVYDVEKNSLSTTEAVFEQEYIETHPCWSPDGKYIYFSRGKDISVTSPKDLVKSKFDMMRISYDVATDTWGSPETVKAYSELGLSCAFPRPSPCGKYVLHILADMGTYPIHRKSSDVYLLDLETKEHRRLDAVCSDLAESYPRWSSNGRWFIFTSNRRDGMSAFPYLAYFDIEGEAHKAFVIPQEDPANFDTFIDTHNVVELVKSRVNISAFRLAQGMKQPPTDAKFPNPPKVDAYTGATKTQPDGY
ncbi:MAG: PD40 domain-containing protein [Planctomycetes bacterium]|nr:PD40 domain-containing protein [Planctomycetota bacterium]MBL7040519.1 PD40 domain-containing protein [Pirellulaceae bacterium]